jgi:uncharacterized membrane-anchored protein
MAKKSNKKNQKVSEYQKLAITLIVLFAILGTFIIFLSIPLFTGKTILLATQPVDPFDIFRGQYMTVNYEISTIPYIEGAEQGNRVYVVLKPDNEGIYRYSSATIKRPSEVTFISGIIRSTNQDTMNIQYGIEQYFFERNAEISTTNLTVEAKVDGSGSARIVQLLKDGKPIEIKYIQPRLAS